MRKHGKGSRVGKRGWIGLFVASAVVLGGLYYYAYGQDNAGFPDGYDATQAVPKSHKLIFENEFVRVLGQHERHNHC